MTDAPCCHVGYDTPQLMAMGLLDIWSSQMVPECANKIESLFLYNSEVNSKIYIVVIPVAVTDVPNYTQIYLSILYCSDTLDCIIWI